MDLSWHQPGPSALVGASDQDQSDLRFYGLLKYFANLILFHPGYLFLVPAFPLISGIWFLMAGLASKDWSKRCIQYLGLFHVQSHWGPCLIHQQAHIFPGLFCCSCTYRSPSSCLWHPWTDSITTALWLSELYLCVLLGDCLCIPPRLPVPASNLYILNFYVWVLLSIHWSSQDLLWWTALDTGGGNPWTSVSFLGYFFPPRPYSMGVF